MVEKSNGDVGGSRLSVERLFDAPPLSGRLTMNPKVSPDGLWVAFSQAADDDPATGVLWVMDCTSGEARALIDMRAFDSSEILLSNEAFRAQQRTHTVGATTAIVFSWRDDSTAIMVSHAGDLFLIALRDGSVNRLTEGGGVEADPQLAPGGHHISYVRQRNLFIRDLERGAEAAIGTDAGPTIGYGTVEFVVQEEFQRFSGVWWSPTGARIAYTRVDETAIPTIPRIGIDTSRLAIVNDLYPLAGTANAETRLFIRDLASGATIEVDADIGDAAYLADVHWSVDGETLLIQRLSRDQQRLDLLATDAATGRIRQLFTETSDTWIDVERDLRPLQGGQFLWGSTRTGWRHLYLYDSDGKLVHPVTQGEWRISAFGPIGMPTGSAIVSVDETAGDVYFTASIDTPIEQHLYRQSYRNPGVPERLTQSGGWWSVAMASTSPSGFVGTFSNPETPPQTAFYNLDGKRSAWISENRLDDTHPLYPYRNDRPRYEFGQIAAESGDILHHVTIKPADFDPARRYPVIVRVYGGPGPQLVRRTWPAVTDQFWMQAGYIVFVLDNRGSGNRSRAFEHVFRHDLGGISAADQKMGLAYLRTLPFVDVDRIGMTGWSFGGYTTLRLMSEPDHGLRAGSVGGTPAAFGIYDTAYSERFLGTPEAEPEAYARSDLLPRLKTLSGEVMVMQGLSDDNVLLINYIAIVDELQKNRKLFDAMVYPGQGHAIGGKVAAPHVLRTAARFFARHLGGSYE